MRTFRLANIKDTLNILKFANLNWGSEHPILNYTEWFVYYYIDMTIGVPRFAICEEDNVIAAICGYILAAEDSDSGKEAPSALSQSHRSLVQNQRYLY